MTRYLILLVSLFVCVATQAEELKPFVRGSQRAIMSSHHGHPFVLALWSLDCTHCRDDMALFARLANKYRNFDLVLVSTDNLTQKREIAHLLRYYHLQNIESWVFADEFTEKLSYEIDPQWYGELPRTYFFDSTGNSTAISGKIDGAQLNDWIRDNNRHG